MFLGEYATCMYYQCTDNPELVVVGMIEWLSSHILGCQNVCLKFRIDSLSYSSEKDALYHIQRLSQPIGAHSKRVYVGVKMLYVYSVNRQVVVDISDCMFYLSPL